MRKPGIQDEAKIQKPSVNYYLICKYTVYLVNSIALGGSIYGLNDLQMSDLCNETT